ncbi:predicted protein [Naegleria gruberi]|uniref:Predicted protein n=1 Tax=Naegleria gruberi TaxID=5762 RepID=D2VZN5_NAEGR|nr:uncharacterized protein NAEGRDRAFT_53544 [Naegleria gruberi]EFC37692.1 predicted protein [Naegleria gruberi]|eukprot:XP_002670436.1 predicted protein [Naegleria gruberi strain NEG-M]
MCAFHIKNLFSYSTLDTDNNPILGKRLDESPIHYSHFVPEQQQFGISLLGVRGSGRTTLMFQYAMGVLKNDPDTSSTVMILLHRNSSPPLPIFDEEDPQVLNMLKRIEVKYIDTYNLLVAFLANIQLLDDISLPRYLFVDNLSAFFASHQKDNPHLSIINVLNDEEDGGEEFNFALLPENNQQQSTTNQLFGRQSTTTTAQSSNNNPGLEALHIRAFALLQNVCVFLSKKFPSCYPNFMVTDSDETFPFYSRWCPIVVTIDHYREENQQQPITNQQKNKSSSFIVKVSSINEVNDPYRMKAVFQLSDSECLLNKLDFALPAL